MRVKRLYKRQEKLLFPPSLEEKISEDNVVRLIDAFVNFLNIESLGFKIRHKCKSDPGASEYHPADLLKIYIYGYINRTRSSRQLARCCKINIEMMWLVGGLTPEHVTIANFRKNNPQPLKKVFRSYNRFLKGEYLFGGDTVAIDGAKFRAQNSRKNNFSDKTIARHLEYIDKKTEEYLSILDQTDAKEIELISKEEIGKKLEELAKRKKHYDFLEVELDKVKKDGDKQISVIDPDSRLFVSKGKGTGEIAFNLQSAVDDKYNLIIHNEITNKVDINALHRVAQQAKVLLETDHINVLADSGYDSGEELKKCGEDNITTYVAPRSQNAGGKKEEFAKNQFKYDKVNDIYICPEGKPLKTNGNVYTKIRKDRKDYRFKEYRQGHSVCKYCIFKEECAGWRLKRHEGRVIQRYLTEDYTEANQERIKANKDYYRRRQAIVEHPFGTIKRQWGYSYTLLKGLEKVGGEFDIICLCYNIRRSVSILGVKELIKRLKDAFSDCLTLFHAIIVCGRSGNGNILLCTGAPRTIR